MLGCLDELLSHNQLLWVTRPLNPPAIPSPTPRRGADPLPIPPTISSHQSPPEFFFCATSPRPPSRSAISPSSEFSKRENTWLSLDPDNGKPHLEASAMCVLLDIECISKSRREHEHASKMEMARDLLPASLVSNEGVVN